MAGKFKLLNPWVQESSFIERKNNDEQFWGPYYLSFLFNIPKTGYAKVKSGPF